MEIQLVFPASGKGSFGTGKSRVDGGSRMSHPRPLGERELNLINLYAYWELEIEPWTFYCKWDVTYEQIALICGRSPVTVRRWFQTGRQHRPASAGDKRHLALMTSFWRILKRFRLN